MTKKNERQENGAETPLNISRRDFVGGTLVGAGAALLNAAAPAHAVSKKFEKSSHKHLLASSGDSQERADVGRGGKRYIIACILSE